MRGNVRWVLALLAATLVGQDASRARANGSLDVRLEFRASSFGTGIGEAGLHAVDLDGDGRPEIVAAASSGGFGPATFWYVLARQGPGYRHIWVSDQSPTPISRLVVGAVDADSAPEILIAMGNAVHVHDGATRERQWTITTGASEIRDLQVADVDADGVAEIVLCAPDGLYVYDAVTGAVELDGIFEGCTSVAIGNVDTDASPEIVLGNQTATGYVIDGVTQAVEWAYPLGFGAVVRVGDLRGDATAEIVGAPYWDQINVFDAVSKVEVDAVYPSHDIGALEVADVEGDGPLEVLWGDGQWGEIHVLSGDDLEEKWLVTNPEHGVTNIVVANTDLDPAKELWWGAGHTSTGPDHLYAVDVATRQTEWASRDFNGPFYGLAHGDLDANGKPDFVYAAITSDSGDEDGLYFVHNAINKRLRYVSPGIRDLEDWTGLFRVQLANVDDDPQLELLAATSDFYQGVVICYDGITHQEQWRAWVEDGLSVRSLQVADLDADGTLEVVFGTEREHSGAPGVFVYVVDAATGTQEWRSPNLSSSWSSFSLLRIAQVDDDPQQEILVAGYNGRLMMFDGITHVLRVLVPDGVTALQTLPLDRHGLSAIYVGTESGEIRRVFPRWTRADGLVGTFGGRIDGLAVRDLDGDRRPDFVFAVDGRVHVYDAGSDTLLWRSTWLGERPGAVDSLLVADIDLDGRLQLMVNTGTGVDIYELAAP